MFFFYWFKLVGLRSRLDNQTKWKQKASIKCLFELSLYDEGPAVPILSFLYADIIVSHLLMYDINYTFLMLVDHFARMVWISHLCLSNTIIGNERQEDIWYHRDHRPNILFRLS